MRLRVATSAAVLLGVAAVGYFAIAQPGPLRPASQSKASAQSSKQKKSEQPVLRGVGSCTATACHGGRTEGNPTWRSAYTVWVNQDPHAKAYSVLHSDRSINMVRQLRGLEEDTRAEPWKEQSCLACHSLAASGKMTAGLFGDGVSCEACHGPAEDWLAEHVTERWEGLTAEQKGRRGMNDTGDLATRAQLCAGCHVGAAASDGRPPRDVNHDLIAAGHPRLNFEFTAYLQNMPPHWDESADRQRRRYTAEDKSPTYDNFEARAWAIGQAATAGAALELLASRASAAQASSDDKDDGHRAPWPEFSELACFDCHHDLQDSKSRQEKVAQGSGSNGLYDWGTWHYPLMEMLANGRLGVSGELDLLAVRSEMSAVSPDANRVASLAVQAREEVARFAAELAGQDYAERLDAMLNGVVDAWHADLDGYPHDWDRMAQYYLACVALHNGAVERRGGMVSSDDRSVQAILLEIRQGLKFPERANSPGDFDAREIAPLVQRLSDAVRDALRQ